MMKVLHISNDFTNSSIYVKLVSELKKNELKQIVYSAVKTKEQSKFRLDSSANIETHIKNILSYHDRVFFRLKIKKITKNVSNEVDLSALDLVHAHTLYSDGAVALSLYRKYDIPYVVSVRSTDLNVFEKYRPDLIFLRNEILSKAKKVVVLSSAYKSRLMDRVNENTFNEIKSKIKVIPNGLDPVFLNNADFNFPNNGSKIKILYVGRFLKLKKIPHLIRVLHALNKTDPLSFTLIGGKGKDEKKVMRMIKSGKYSFVDYLGWIKDKTKIKEIYRSHDIFMMLSKRETFGLVYLEALSQGCPVIHTKGEGIDGYFTNQDFAESVTNLNDTSEIIFKIKKLKERLDSDLREKCIASVQNFSWHNIALAYKKLYT